jgi:hypothetical protein
MPLLSKQIFKCYLFYWMVVITPLSLILYVYHIYIYIYTVSILFVATATLLQTWETPLGLDVCHGFI